MAAIMMFSRLHTVLSPSVQARKHHYERHFRCVSQLNPLSYIVVHYNSMIEPRFPTNPFSCAKWVSIVARERGEEFYRPAKSSVICSDHFDKSDITTNSNRRRLIKTAVPKLKIQPPLMDIQFVATNTENSESDTEVKPSSSPGLGITQKTCNQDQAEHNSAKTSPAASVSDLIPVYESPKEIFLQKKLLTARKLINIKTKKIQTLQKVNKRLEKKNSTLKNIVHLLKKKQIKD